MLRLQVAATRLFEGDSAAANRWLRRGNKALGGRSPIEFGKTSPQTREVAALIARLEQGIFT
jgi:putative toxin-antitoxin system antitoxin component (TIGR02293 family)